MKALVLSARGLHLGFLSCYGNEWIATPTLDRLAAEGIVFDQHIADCPEALGAHRAWRSGRYQLPPVPGEVAPPAQGSADLVALLRGQGIGTMLIVDGSRSALAEFADGWDDVTVVAAPDGDSTPLEATLEATVQALDRLACLDQWLLWVDLATLLPPWDVPQEFRERYFEDDEANETEDESAAANEEPLLPLPDPVPGPLETADRTTFLRLQRSYAGAVTFLDAGLELLIQELQQRHLMEEILCLLAADHGYALGEHGLVGDGRPWLHDELVHVPLLVRLPGGTEGGRRIGTLTQPVDLLPTLLEFFGVPVPITQGYSLVPLCRGHAGEVRRYACSGLQRGDTVEWALRSTRWAFLLPLGPAKTSSPRTPQLYVKPDDRWEVNNVLHHHQELGEHLEQTLRGFVAASRQPGALVPPELRDGETDREWESPSSAAGDES